MNQYQYQNKNQYDPFAEEEEEILQDHERFHPSSMLMRDLESYARQQEKKKTFRFRMTSLLVAAMISVPIMIAGRAIMYSSHRDYEYSEDYTIEDVEDYDEYHVYDFHYDGGADEYYDPGDGELGDDLGEPELLLNGTYYHLPAPLHVFVEDGWNVVYNGYEGEPPAEIDGSWSQYITLEKDGHYLNSVSIGSPSGEPVPIENSYVLGFYVDRWSEINLELPGGIMIGTDMDDAIEAMRGSTLEVEELDYEYGTDISGQKRINTYGDYKYWNVRFESYRDDDALVDWITLDTRAYKY